MSIGYFKFNKPIHVRTSDINNVKATIDRFNSNTNGIKVTTTTTRPFLLNTTRTNFLKPIQDSDELDNIRNSTLETSDEDYSSTIKSTVLQTIAQTLHPD